MTIYAKRKSVYIWVVALMFCLVSVRSQAVNASEEKYQIRVEANKMQGLLDFALSVANHRQGSRTLRELYLQSEYGKQPEPASVSHMRELNFDRNAYEYPGLPKGHGQTVLPFDRLLAGSVVAKDWREFYSFSAGVLSLEQQTIVVSAMRDLEPAYDKLIWLSYGQTAKTKAKNLQAYLDKNKGEEIFSKLGVFYGTPWPVDLELRVGFSPLPPDDGFTASVKGNTVRSFMPVNFGDYSSYAGVVFHELGHQLLGNQPVATASNLRKWFVEDSNNARLYAQLWFDEAVATAAGNAWVNQNLTGKTLEGEWYSNAVIDNYAKAIAPMTAEYLESNRSIDSEYVHRAIALFAKVMPDYMSNKDVLLPFLALISDAEGSQFNDYQKSLLQNVPLRGFHMRAGKIDVEALRETMDSPGTLLLLLTKTPSTETAGLLKKHWPCAISMASAETQSCEFEGRKILFIRADTVADWDRALRGLESSL